MVTVNRISSFSTLYPGFHLSFDCPPSISNIRQERSMHDSDSGNKGFISEGGLKDAESKGPDCLTSEQPEAIVL